MRCFFFFFFFKFGSIICLYQLFLNWNIYSMLVSSELRCVFY